MKRPQIRRYYLDRDEGTELPRFYGFVWRDPRLRRDYLLPIPLNWIVRWGRDGYWKLMEGKRDRTVNDAYAEGWENGQRYMDWERKVGRKEGYRAGRRHERNAMAIRMTQVVDEGRADGPAMKAAKEEHP